MKRTVYTYLAVHEYYNWEEDRKVKGTTIKFQFVGKPTTTQVRKIMKAQGALPPSRDGRINLTVLEKAVYEMDNDTFMKYATRCPDGTEPDEDDEE